MNNKMGIDDTKIADKVLDVIFNAVKNGTSEGEKKAQDYIDNKTWKLSIDKLKIKIDDSKTSKEMKTLIQDYISDIEAMAQSALNKSKDELSDSMNQLFQPLAEGSFAGKQDKKIAKEFASNFIAGVVKGVKPTQEMVTAFSGLFESSTAEIAGYTKNLTAQIVTNAKASTKEIEGLKENIELVNRIKNQGVSALKNNSIKDSQKGYAVSDLWQLSIKDLKAVADEAFEKAANDTSAEKRFFQAMAVALKKGGAEFSNEYINYFNNIKEHADKPEAEFLKNLTDFSNQLKSRITSLKDALSSLLNMQGSGEFDSVQLFNTDEFQKIISIFDKLSDEDWSNFGLNKADFTENLTAIKETAAESEKFKDNQEMTAELSESIAPNIQKVVDAVKQILTVSNDNPFDKIETATEKVNGNFEETKKKLTDLITKAQDFLDTTLSVEQGFDVEPELKAAQEMIDKMADDIKNMTSLEDVFSMSHLKWGDGWKNKLANGASVGNDLEGWNLLQTADLDSLEYNYKGISQFVSFILEAEKERYKYAQEENDQLNKQLIKASEFKKIYNKIKEFDKIQYNLFFDEDDEYQATATDEQVQRDTKRYEQLKTEINELKDTYSAFIITLRDGKHIEISNEGWFANLDDAEEVMQNLRAIRNVELVPIDNTTDAILATDNLFSSLKNLCSEVIDFYNVLKNTKAFNEYIDGMQRWGAIVHRSQDDIANTSSVYGSLSKVYNKQSSATEENTQANEKNAESLKDLIRSYEELNSLNSFYNRSLRLTKKKLKNALKSDYEDEHNNPYYESERMGISLEEYTFRTHMQQYLHYKAYKDMGGSDQFLGKDIVPLERNLEKIKNYMDSLSDSSDEFFRVLENIYGISKNEFENAFDSLPASVKEFAGMTEQVINQLINVKNLYPNGAFGEILDKESLNYHHLASSIQNVSVESEQQTSANEKNTESLKALLNLLYRIKDVDTTIYDDENNIDWIGFYSNREEAINESLAKNRNKLHSQLNLILSEDNEALNTVQAKVNELQSKLTPLQEIINRISKNSSITSLYNWDNYDNEDDYNKASAEAYNEIGKRLGELKNKYELTNEELEEYITLQFKAEKIIEKETSNAGGVKGSGASDKNQLREWIRKSFAERLGESLTDLYHGSFGNIIDALYGYKNLPSLYNDSGKKQNLSDMVADVFGYNGKSFGSSYFKKDSTELNNLNTILNYLKKNLQDIQTTDFSSQIEYATGKEYLTKELSQLIEFQKRLEAVRDDIAYIKSITNGISIDTVDASIYGSLANIVDKTKELDNLFEEQSNGQMKLAGLSLETKKEEEAQEELNASLTQGQVTLDEYTASLEKNQKFAASFEEQSNGQMKLAEIVGEVSAKEEKAETTQEEYNSTIAQGQITLDKYVASLEKVENEEQQSASTSEQTNKSLREQAEIATNSGEKIKKTLKEVLSGYKVKDGRQITFSSLIGDDESYLDKFNRLKSELEEIGYTLVTVKEDSAKMNITGAIVEIGKESEAFAEVSTTATRAARGKNDFTKANKKAKESIDTSLPAIVKEDQAFNDTAADSNKASTALSTLTKTQEEVRQEAKAAAESILEERDAISQIGLYELDENMEGGFSFVEPGADGQVRTVFMQWDNDLMQWVETVGDARTNFKGLENEILRADKQLGTMQRTLAKNKATLGTGYDSSALEENIALQQKYIDDLLDTLETYSKLDRYMYQGTQYEELLAKLEAQRAKNANVIANDTSVRTAKSNDSYRKQLTSMQTNLQNMLVNPKDKYTKDFQKVIQSKIEEISNKYLANDAFTNMSATDLDDFIAKYKSFIAVDSKARSVLTQSYDTISKYQVKLAKNMNSNSAMSKEMRDRFEELYQVGNRMKGTKLYSDEDYAKWINDCIKVEAEMYKTGQTGKSAFDKIKQSITSANVQLLSMYFSWQDWIRYARTALSYVEELDSALTELRIVSQSSSDSLEGISNIAFNLAQNLGSTTTEVIESITSWRRLGYSIEESTELAEQASRLSIGGLMDTDTATEALTSALEAYDELDVSNLSEAVDDFIYLGKILPKGYGNISLSR